MMRNHAYKKAFFLCLLGTRQTSKNVASVCENAQQNLSTNLISAFSQTTLTSKLSNLMNPFHDLPTFQVAVQNLLDGQTTAEDEKQLMNFLATSPWHSRYFENEKQFHSFLKGRIERKKAPEDLKTAILEQFHNLLPQELESQADTLSELVYIEVPK
jgi:hypothetical protein